MIICVWSTELWQKLLLYGTDTFFMGFHRAHQLHGRGLVSQSGTRSAERCHLLVGLIKKTHSKTVGHTNLLQQIVCSTQKFWIRHDWTDEQKCSQRFARPQRSFKRVLARATVVSNERVRSALCGPSLPVSRGIRKSTAFVPGWNPIVFQDRGGILSPRRASSSFLPLHQGSQCTASARSFTKPEFLRFTHRLLASFARFGFPGTFSGLSWARDSQVTKGLNVSVHPDSKHLTGNPSIQDAWRRASQGETHKRTHTRSSYSSTAIVTFQACCLEVCFNKFLSSLWYCIHVLNKVVE